MSLESLLKYENELNKIIDKANEKIKIYNEKLDNIQKSLGIVKEKFWTLMRKGYDSVIHLYVAVVKNYEKDCITYQRNVDQCEKR